MKKRKVLRITVFFVIMIMLFTACAGSKKDASFDTTQSENSTSNGSQQKNDMMDVSGTSDTADAQDSGSDGIENSSALSSDPLKAATPDKIIKNFNLEVETQDFDKLIKSINDEIKSLVGYVESSSISGQSFYDSNVTRSGHIVARIPSAKVDEFVSNVDETANVTKNESSTENVTLKYIDAQSRVETLKIEQDRLFAILEKSKDLESIITLESRLSEIRYELQNYESQLRAYDNLVEYSTVTLNIAEVERITPVTEKKPTFGTRITTGFSDSIYNISEGAKNFFVWLIVNLPYLLIWGVVILIAVIIVRRIIKKMDLTRTIQPPTNYGQFNSNQHNEEQKNQSNQDQNQHKL